MAAAALPSRRSAKNGRATSPASAACARAEPTTPAALSFSASSPSPSFVDRPGPRTGPSRTSVLERRLALEPLTAGRAEERVGRQVGAARGAWLRERGSAARAEAGARIDWSLARGTALRGRWSAHARGRLARRTKTLRQPHGPTSASSDRPRVTSTFPHPGRTSRVCASNCPISALCVGSGGTGCGANPPSVEAQAPSAPARQLTPPANEGVICCAQSRRHERSPRRSRS
jgi:hypothetical protein